MKKTLSLLLAFVCLSNMFQPAFAENQVIIMNDNGNQPIKIEGPQPFINEQNRTLIPLSWVDNVLKSKVTYEQNENQIVMKQFGLETDTILKFECGNPILYRNDTEEILMDTSPCSMDGVIYLPLRSMAMSFRSPGRISMTFQPSFLLETSHSAYLSNTASYSACSAESPRNNGGVMKTISAFAASAAFLRRIFPSWYA